MRLGVIGGVDPTSNVVYAPGSLGPALADTAALVRADIGVRLVAIDLGGWDHHSGEEERLAPLAGQLASGLATFRDDLGTDWSRTAVLVMTEFGRTAAENGSAGTDHGHGTFMACTGGRVAGGRVVMKNDAWPGLGPSQLFEGRDPRGDDRLPRRVRRRAPLAHGHAARLAGPGAPRPHDQRGEPAGALRLEDRGLSLEGGGSLDG